MPGIEHEDEQHGAGDEDPRREALPGLHRHLERDERGEDADVAAAFQVREHAGHPVHLQLAGGDHLREGRGAARAVDHEQVREAGDEDAEVVRVLGRPSSGPST